MAVTASSPSSPFVRNVLRTTVMTAPASTQINPGDFIWSQGAGLAGIASAFTWNTNLATTQPLFGAVFVGVAMDMRIASDPTTGKKILVMTEGDCYYPCTALGAALDIGAFVGLDKDPAGNNLLDQTVVGVATANLAVGKLQEAAPIGSTGLLFRMVGKLSLGGVS